MAEPQGMLKRGGFLWNEEQMNLPRYIFGCCMPYELSELLVLFLTRTVAIFLTVTSLKFLVRRKSAR